MIRRLSLMLSIAVTIGLFATTSRVFLASQAVANPHAHVMVIAEENHAYSSIIGQSAAPYINSLASTYALATNSYASTHDSLGNYLGLISGSIQGVPFGTDKTPLCYPCSAPTLTDELTHQGTSWKAYMESMPATCDTTLGSSGNYAARHNPFVYFSGVTTTPAECNSVVPFTTSQIATDLNSSAAPDFVWMTPNLVDDMHSGTIQPGDAWLQSTMATVLASAWYQANGVVIITWDESAGSDSSGLNGYRGGHIATIVVSKSSHGSYAAGVNQYRDSPRHRGGVRSGTARRVGGHRQRRPLRRVRRGNVTPHANAHADANANAHVSPPLASHRARPDTITLTDTHAARRPQTRTVRAARSAACALAPIAPDLGGWVVNVTWASLQPTQGGPIAANNAIDQAIALIRSQRHIRAHASAAASDRRCWGAGLGQDPRRRARLHLQHPGQRRRHRAALLDRAPSSRRTRTSR